MAEELSRTRHFLVLDGLRGVAAIAVVSLHICEYFQLGFAPVHAYLAVDFFFMLSGFVVAHAYDERLRRGMSRVDFVTVRLIRLHPLVLLGIALGTLAFVLRAYIGGSISYFSILAAAVTNALFLPTPALLYLRPWAFPVDTPLWSLSFELGVNLLYAACFSFLGKRELALAGFVGGVLLCITAATHGGLNTGYAWSDFYLGGARVLFPFVAGIVMSRMMAGRPARTRWGHLTVVPLLLILTAPAIGGSFFDILAVLLAFPIILIWGAQTTPNRWLDPLWRRLGTLSYPIYAIHYPFVVVLSNIAKARHAQTMAPILAVLTLLIVVVAAWAASEWYDVPVRRWLGRRLTATAVRTERQIAR